MSLLSTDITKVKRLSLREVRLPAPDSRVDLITLVERPPTDEEIVARLKEATNVNQERAEIGFKLMLQAGALETTPVETYYLINSTPF